MSLLGVLGSLGERLLAFAARKLAGEVEKALDDDGPAQPLTYDAVSHQQAQIKAATSHGVVTGPASPRAIAPGYVAGNTARPPPLPSRPPPPSEPPPRAASKPPAK